MFGSKYKIILVLISIFTLMLLAYVFYKSEIVLSGKKNDEYFKFYILLIIFLVINNLFLFFSEKFKQNYILCLFSILSIIYIIEIFISFNKKKFFNEINLENNSNIFSPYEFYKNSNKKEFIPVVSPSNFLKKKNNEFYKELFPLAGLSNKNTIFCNESNNVEFYFSDRHGFNNNDQLWEKNIDIVFIGDSFTQGVCVKREDNISSIISKKTQKQILNLGYGGNGPLIEFATLREYGFKFKPKKVFWFYFEGNDLEELFDELNNPILKKYYNRRYYSQKIMNKQNKVDFKILNILKQKEKDVEKISHDDSKFIEIIKLRNIRNLTKFNKKFLKKDKFSKIIKNFEKIIFKSKVEVESWGGELYFVYLPDYSRFINKDNTRFKKSYILEKIEKLGIKTIDIDNLVFKKKNDPLSFFPNRKNNHYNKVGYYEIAKEIIKFIN